jgi:hypothetical protein
VNGRVHSDTKNTAEKAKEYAQYADFAAMARNGSQLAPAFAQR